MLSCCTPSLNKAWATGLMNIEIPEAYGGLGGSCLDNCLVQEEVARILEDAGRALRHEFDLLGSGPVGLGVDDRHRLVALGLGVGVGEHGDGVYAEVAAGAEHPTGDLGAVGDKDLGDGQSGAPRPERGKIPQ